MFTYNFSFYCLSFCSNVSNYLGMWGNYEIVILIVFFSQLFILIVCLFSKFFSDIRFRMKGCKDFSSDFNILDC